jgi:hypothetical protein
MCVARLLELSLTEDLYVRKGDLGIRLPACVEMVESQLIVSEAVIEFVDKDLAE